MLNWRLSAFIVAVVVGVLLLAVILTRRESADALSVQPSAWNRVLAWLGFDAAARDAGPDDIVFFDMKAKSDSKAQVRLGIPKKYLHSFDASSSTKTYRFTTIEALLPDMRPASESLGQFRAQESLTPERYAPLRQHVSIEWSGGQSARDYTPQKHYESFVRRSRFLGSTDSGLIHLREQSCSPVGPAGPTPGTLPGPDGQQCVFVGNDLFTFKPVAGQEWVFFRCTQLPAPRAGICRAHTHVRNWGIEYRFYRSELPRWREFDAGVRRLMESFFEAGLKGKKD